MNTRKIYRDGLEETIQGKIKVINTRDGHVVECYKLASGAKRYFATLAGLPFCAHGDTLEEAITDALWKDESKRPSMEALKKKIIRAGRSRKISLNEFRLLTGACLTGCKEAIKQAGHDGSPLTAKEIIDKINKPWGEKLMQVLEWKN